MKNFLETLILDLQNSDFNLETRIKEMLDAIIEQEVEVKQPTDVKGVKQLLCAIHTYKI